MSSTANQPLSESTLLTRYLLTPSSLPTILPYSTFLSLLPTSTRNDTDLQPHLRRLYADLQFQRNLDIDTVRANIARECARAGTVKATLRKDLARELGGDGNHSDPELEYVDMEARTKREESVELAPSRKRKRAHATGEEDDNNEEDNRDSSLPRSHSEDEDADDDDDDDDNEASRQLRREEGPVIPESPSSSAPSSPAPTARATITASSLPQTHYDAALDTAFHGPRGLALPSAATPQTHQPYHTRTSLLSAMEAAIADLQGEIANLESEAARTMDGLRETVGGLSDLRYGKLSRDSGGTGVERDLEEGLRALREVAERKLQDI